MVISEKQFPYQCKKCDTFPYATQEDLDRHDREDHRVTQPWGSTTSERVWKRPVDPTPDPAFDQEKGMAEYKRTLRKRAEVESKPYTQEQRVDERETHQANVQDMQKIRRSAASARRWRTLAKSANKTKKINFKKWQ